MSGRHAQARSGGSRVSAAVAIGLLVALAGMVATMVILWPEQPQDLAPDAGQRTMNASVTAIHQVPCPQGAGARGRARPSGCGTAEVVLTDGGQRRNTTANLPSGAAAPHVAVGDEVIVAYTESAPRALRYQIVDHQRGTQLWIICGACALAVLAFGRWRGLAAIVGLAVTFAVLLRFVVPAILEGRPPLLVAIVGSAVVMLTVLYLTHGVSRTTTVAVVGTLASLALTGLLAAGSVRAVELTGVADDTSAYVGQIYGVDTRGLLLAGILIGALGVLDDVTVTQATTVEELARANPGYRFTELFRGATRVGRAHIASVVNTIVLAYAGASLPLLVIIVAGTESLSGTLTDQLIAQELVRSAVGTIGLIAAVPITTALAAVAASTDV